MSNFPRRLLWSSEGGGLVPSTALTAAQKTANGNSGALDVAPYRELLLMVVLTGFTAGTTPSFQPEWDALDDAGTPDTAALWKPTAATSATKWLEVISDSALTDPTVTGWTVGHIQYGFGALGQFAWTIVGAPTATAWTAYIYGK